MVKLEFDSETGYYVDNEWLNSVIELIKNRPNWLTITQISKKTGVSKCKISSILNGCQNDPGIQSVWNVRCYLIKIHNELQSKVENKS